MELHWKQEQCQYLHRNVRQVQNLEQTQELRLPDGMPDIGRVLCAWGQSMVRSKEWRNEGMVISGGVNVWVLYAPEDGTEPRSVELWLPFTGKWNFPDSHREGTIRVTCQLRGVDGRSLSSRKIMVRTTVAVLAEAMEMAECTVYTAGEVPQDVQILENTYPAMLPKEAGEKLFVVDETMPLEPPARKILACDVIPVVQEQSAAGSRVVFRGNCRVHVVYMGDDDRVHSGYYNLPFAQFEQLDHAYDKDATAGVMLAVSGLETELMEGQLHIAANLIGQFVIFDRCMLCLTADAYSPFRSVQMQTETLCLPMLLEEMTQQLELTQEKQLPAAQVADVTFFQEFPIQYREGDGVMLELHGAFQTLFYDLEGNLCTDLLHAQRAMHFPAGENCMIWTDVAAVKAPEHRMAADKLCLDAVTQMEILTTAQQMLPMVSALTLGEKVTPDPKRPSLILQRKGEYSLWELAKRCGSTVDAIRNANALSADAMPEQMLLIPVL